MAPVCHTVWAWIHRNTLLAHVTDVPYLVFLGQPVQAYVRSADTRTLAVNRTSPCSSFGDRTFAAAGTRLWNRLPPDLRQRELSYGQFTRSLNTFLFGQWDHGTVWTLLTAPSRNILTYLLTYLLTYWEIRWKNWTHRVPPFKVSQNHLNRHRSIGYLWLPIGDL